MTSATKPSTPRLSERAAEFVIPEGIVTTGWPKIEAKGRELGIGFDWWQRHLGTVALGKREDGKYAATVGGVVLSIPRQVGKTYFVGALMILMCICFPGLQVVWSAHHLRTTTKTFKSLEGIVKRKRIRPYLADNRSEGIRTANGEQEIRFANGSSIMFGARSQGFGRGFDEIDVEVFDEAQILEEKALEDMIAATNQSRHPHGALIFYMGTPPRPLDPGEAFIAKRRKALSGKSKDLLYLECSADRGSDPDDRAQWAKANFSYPDRTPVESMMRLRENLSTEDAWLREALGIWDEEALMAFVVGADEWKSTGVAEPPSDGIRSLGVKFSPDGSSVAVSGAMKHEAGIHVELVGAHSGSMSSGTASLASWIAERSSKYAAIVVDGKSHGGAFVNALIEAGVSKKAIIVPTWPEVATANSMLLDGLILHQVTHLATEGQSVLDDSATRTIKKIRGTEGAWQWDCPADPALAVPIQSAALAHFGAKTSKRRPGRKQTVSY